MCVAVSYLFSRPEDVPSFTERNVGNSDYVIMCATSKTSLFEK